VDDAHEVGVLQILVGQRVAPIAVAREDHRVERGDVALDIAAAARLRADVASERREMMMVAGEIHSGPLKRRQGQGGRRERQRSVGHTADLTQKGLRGAAIVEAAVNARSVLAHHLSGVTSMVLRCTGASAGAVSAVGAVLAAAGVALTPSGAGPLPACTADGSPARTRT